MRFRMKNIQLTHNQLDSKEVEKRNVKEPFISFKRRESQ